ncbi:plasmid mobilization protein [Gluconacetobacter tumulicola]|uniref:Plasmid mobilization relaxosome protein MobC n=1 Tax=Gluconacetobacter tumulicola TaxID=1017177 RepID=A0A7W4JES2_9PROT|nr:plasmid mobilization relaxosome protein MobC [Gluconacetobacter tumulicola]MBB2179915.1 plasmid mobilization relaxosome protein MobC [Gluconacetobacter tumulicola]
MKKTANVRVRMTPSEESMIRQNAGSRGASGFIRRCLLDYQASGPALRDDIVAIRSELSAIGNNLNQIAKKLNSGHELAGELYTEIEALPELRGKLNAILSRVT